MNERERVNSVRAQRILAGRNVRLRETPVGTVIHFDGGRVRWEHAWELVSVGPKGAVIRPGTVNGVMGMIEGVRLDDAKSRPTLRWDRLDVDGDGRGYVCAEVTVDTAKNGWAVKSVEMVQVKDPNDGSRLAAGVGGAAPLMSKGADGKQVNTARWPVAMLRVRKGGAMDVFQVVYFPLQHGVALREDGTIQRHFFW